jgi:polysaccharide biosynthesis protein PslH
VLDLMAAGLPVVTTSVGAEGLDVRDGVHLVIADTPQAFAGAVGQLLDEATVATELGRNARQLVQERYAWPAVQDLAAGLVERVTGDAATA